MCRKLIDCLLTPEVCAEVLKMGFHQVINKHEKHAQLAHKRVAVHLYLYPPPHLTHSFFWQDLIT